MVIDLVFQPLDERLDLLREPDDPLAAHDLGIDDRPDALHRVVEIVVDDDVLVLVDRPQFLQC